MNLRGKIWLLEDGIDQAVGTVLAIGEAGDEITISTADGTLGTWLITDLAVKKHGDSDFLLIPDNEEIVFRPDSPAVYTAFAKATTAPTDLADRIRAASDSSQSKPSGVRQRPSSPTNTTRAPDTFQPPGAKKKQPMSEFGKFLVAVVGVILVGGFLLSRCIDTDAIVDIVDNTPSRSSNEPGSASVYARINSLTDCNQLQGEFDQAADNHDRESLEGDLEMMKIASSYMAAADARMREVGCYD